MLTAGDDVPTTFKPLTDEEGNGGGFEVSRTAATVASDKKPKHLLNIKWMKNPKCALCKAELDYKPSKKNYHRCDKQCNRIGSSSLDIWDNLIKSNLVMEDVSNLNKSSHVVALPAMM
uniref:Uncharacterized protein n=1 Tax=Romanomermis culicivorax TaxID=13658 RepID=A0A915I5H3_ROMCU